MNYKIISVLLNFIILALGFSVYLVISGYGFPDGHLTDYHKASKSLGKLFLIVSALYSVHFTYIGFLKSNITVETYIPATCSYIILICIFLFTDYYLYQTLDHGRGG